MNKLILTVGISASGKTTWAESQKQSVNINRDDLRRSMFSTPYKYTKEKETIVTQEQFKLAEFAIETNDVIISDTNLNYKTLNSWTNWAKGKGVELEIKEFPISIEEAFKRDLNRVYTVGLSVLFRQWYSWCEYKGIDLYKNQHKLPHCIIVDIDGTVAIKGDRSPFDWMKVDLDSPRSEIIELIYGYLHINPELNLIFLSGRDSVCYDLTNNWIKKYFPDYSFQLFMRPENDCRPDYIVKEELYNNHIKNKFNVNMVFDDRPQVVRLWHSLKLPNVIAVANPYIEF